MGTVTKLPVPHFRITSTYKGTNYFEVNVEMNVSVWKAQDKGMLYGVDISNQVGQKYPEVNAWNPSVDDSQRARKGWKTIRLTYLLKEIRRGN
jgi:hypothetical protein